MSDMHPQMANDIAESRGYDRGFTGGILHAHNLLSQYIDWLNEYIIVLEEEGDCSHEISCYRTQINALQYAKLTIRKGHWDADSEMPWK